MGRFLRELAVALTRTSPAFTPVARSGESFGAQLSAALGRTTPAFTPAPTPVRNSPRELSRTRRPRSKRTLENNSSGTNEIAFRQSEIGSRIIRVQADIESTMAGLGNNTHWMPEGSINLSAVAQSVEERARESTASLIRLGRLLQIDDAYLGFVFGRSADFTRSSRQREAFVLGGQVAVLRVKLAQRLEVLYQQIDGALQWAPPDYVPQLRDLALIVREMTLSSELESPFKGANLSGYRVSAARIGKISMQGSDLSNIDLSNGSMIDLNLTQTNLRGADLRGAKMVRVDLSGADLTDAQLTPDRMTSVLWTRETQWPGALSEQIYAGSIDRGDGQFEFHSVPPADSPVGIHLY